MYYHLDNSEILKSGFNCIENKIINVSSQENQELADIIRADNKKKEHDDLMSEFDLA